MRPSLLELLRCPFCGGTLAIDADAPSRHEGEDLWSGVLACQCCAYPVVDGIPCVRMGDDAGTAVRLVTEGRADEARLALLGLDGVRRTQFTEARDAGDAFTFRRALEILSPNPEGTYLLYRFSDPTFVASQALLQPLASELVDASDLVLDLCCGTGHLARVVADRVRSASVVMADLSFWKVWLAKRFVAPTAQPLCCDANEPLPFAPGVFAFAYCSDAFHYVWQRRRCADELSRAVREGGAVVLAHVHNALAANHSEGLPLTPAAYVGLFERAPVRLFPDSTLLAAALGGHDVDLSRDEAPDALAAEPALNVVATRRTDLFRAFHQAAQTVSAVMPPSAELNPLYQPVEAVESASVWQLRFPSPEYEAEYAACRRYLPDRVELDEERRRLARAGQWDGDLRTLLARRVLLDLPPRYL